MVKNVIHNNNGIMIIANVSVKSQYNIAYMKKIMLWILAYILASVIKVVRSANNWKVAPAENVSLMI